MDVAEEHQPAPFGRPLVTLIDAYTRMRRAVMAPIDNRRQALARQVANVAVRIRPGAALAIVLTARRHVEEVMNHARAHEGVAALAPIHTPRITCAVSEHLEFFGARMIAGERGIHLHAETVEVVRVAHFRVS